MAVAVTHVSLFEQVERRALSDLLRVALRYLPVLAIVGLVVGIHMPSMGYYFFGDDFLVLGDVNTRSFPSYVADVTLLRDMTPNWRPLTMVVYYGEWQLFGLDALPWRIVNLTVHCATIVLLYALLLAMTKRMLVATAAALIFGVSASAVHTVTYITALPHVLSEFLLIASLAALYRYVESGERTARWYWASFGLYVLGFLANEGGVVIGAVLLVYYATASFARRRDALDITVKMAPFGLAAAVLIAVLAGSGKQGVEEGFYGFGWHIPREMWVYMSRLAYPVGAIDIDPSASEWIWGSIVAAAAIFFFLRGPNIARFAAVGMVIGLAPYAPGKIWTATRYTYMALPFFGILVAIAAAWVHAHAERYSRPLAHALAGAALVAVGGLYAWQTMHQSEPFLKETSRWQLLVDDLRASYEEVPAGTTVWVIDDAGLWTNAYWQPTWMTSVGRAVYGDDVAVRALPSDFFEAMRESLDDPVYLVEYQDGHLRRVSPATATQPPE
jgi:hypothetical protein